MSRALAIGLGLLALLLAGARIALPGLLHDQAVASAREQGLDLTIGDVSLSLLAGELELTGVAVATADAEAGSAGDGWLRVGRAAANLAWWPLVSRTVHLSSFELERGSVRLIHHEGALAIPWTPPESTPDEPEDAAESTVDDAWAFRLDQLALSDVTVAVAPHDLAHEGSLRLDNASVGDLVFAEGRLTTRSIEIGNPELDGDLGAFAPEAPPAAEEPAPIAEAHAEEIDALIVALDHIDLRDSTFRIRLDPERALEGTLSLRTRQFSTEADTRFGVEAELGIAGGDIELTGEVGLAPLGFAFDIEAGDLSLASLAAIASPAVATWLRDGTASATARVSSTDGVAVVASGAVSLAALDFRAPEGESLSLALPALDITLNEVRTGTAPRAELGPIALKDAEIKVRSPDPALDALVASLSSGEADDETGTTSEDETDDAGAFAIDVAGISIDGVGLALHIAGEPGDTPFDLAFDEITARSGRAGMPLRIDDLELTSLVNGTTPFHLGGSARGGEGDFEADIDGLALPPFNPLVGRVGYEIGAGEAALETTVSLRGEHTRLSNAIALTDLALESDGAFEEAFGLPVSAAIALLEDVGGTIHLDVPVSIDAAGSGVDLGPILLTAVRQAVLGAVTSPLKLVGATLDLAAGGEDDAPLGSQGIEMRSGLATLSEAGERQLRSLGRLLDERPGLRVTLTGRADPAEVAAAGPGLADQRVELARAWLIEEFPETADRVGRGVTAPPPTPPGVPGEPPVSAAPTTTGVAFRLGVAAREDRPDAPAAPETPDAPVDAVASPPAPDDPV